VLFVHIRLTNFERVLLIPIHLETQSAIELARGFLGDRHTESDLLEICIATDSVQQPYQHGLRYALAPCCRSHVYAPDRPFVVLFAPFLSKKSRLADHLTALEGPDYEVTIRHGTQPGSYALGGPRALLLKGAAKGIGLAC
jgi:hypothetical protein